MSYPALFFHGAEPEIIPDIISSSPYLSYPQGQILSYPGQPLRNLSALSPFTYIVPTRSSSAATEKHTETGNNARFAYGLSEMQGWRLSEFKLSTLLPFSRVCKPHATSLASFSPPRSGKIPVFSSPLRPFLTPDLALACSHGRCTCDFIKS